MKKILGSAIPLFCGFGLALCAPAQVVVPVSTLPGIIGEYDLSYVRTNLNLASIIGNAGSNYWDFSQAPTSADVIMRTDIIAVSDGSDGSYFTNATFAERYTGGINASPSYEYYQISNGVGRLYYGLYDEQNQEIDPLILFPEATTDLPDPIQYSHGWNRSLDYQINTIVGPEDVAFSETAAVDAYGTLVLPGFGSLQALRVTEIDSYDISVSGIDFGTEVDTNYIWLVPGIGYAAEAIIYGPDPLGDPQPFTNYFQRAFLQTPLIPGSATSLSLQSNIISLNWGATKNAGGYVVTASTNLATTNWTPLAQMTNNTLSIQIRPGIQRQFYRVTAQP